MIVKVISGGCDVYPKGSIHGIEDLETRKVFQTRDVIPFGYKLLSLYSMPVTVRYCPDCKNAFDIDHPFLFSSDKQKEVCLRCFERLHVTGDRDAYRLAVEKMISIDKEEARRKDIENHEAGWSCGRD